MSKYKQSPKKLGVPTKEFTLIQETSISGVIRPKGYKVKLSEAGEESFRKKNRIE